MNWVSVDFVIDLNIHDGFLLINIHHKLNFFGLRWYYVDCVGLKEICDSHNIVPIMA